MAQDSETFNKDLYDLLKVRGYQPVPLNDQNQRVPASQEADVMEFSFNKDGKDYGKAWISVEDASQIVVYFSEEQRKSPNAPTPGADFDDTWTGLLKHLKTWAQRRQLGFELANKDRLGDDMKQRQYYKQKAKVQESYHPVNKKTTYSDAVPAVKIILQHSRNLEEGEQRYRNVARIFLENVDGERFLAPTTKPGLAKVYARHIAEGGLPNDDKWNHIKNICEEYAKLGSFVRATRNKEFNESAMQLIENGIEHYQDLRKTLGRMTSHNGYHTYFEGWTPMLMEDDLDESINDLFVQEMIDPRIESAMPILAKLRGKSSNTAVESLAEWAEDVISEKLELSENDEEQLNELSIDAVERYVDKADKKAMQAHYTKKAGNQESKKTYNKRAKGLSMAGKKLGGQARVPATESVGATFKKIDDYSDWHDRYLVGLDGEYEETDLEGQLLGVAWTGAGVRGVWYNAQNFGTISSTAFEDEVAYIETDPNSPWLNENLDRNQKKAGQLGPTEKVGKNGARGKLVGEAGPFNYGAKSPRTGSVTHNAMTKRKKDLAPTIEPKDQMMGTAKITKDDTELDNITKLAGIKNNKNG